MAASSHWGNSAPHSQPVIGLSVDPQDATENWEDDFFLDDDPSAPAGPGSARPLTIRTWEAYATGSGGTGGHSELREGIASLLPKLMQTATALKGIDVLAIAAAEAEAGIAGSIPAKTKKGSAEPSRVASPAAPSVSESAIPTTPPQSNTGPHTTVHHTKSMTESGKGGDIVVELVSGNNNTTSDETRNSQRGDGPDWLARHSKSSLLTISATTLTSNPGSHAASELKRAISCPSIHELLMSQSGRGGGGGEGDALGDDATLTAAMTKSTSYPDLSTFMVPPSPNATDPVPSPQPSGQQADEEDEIYRSVPLPEKTPPQSPQPAKKRTPPREVAVDANGAAGQPVSPLRERTFSDPGGSSSPGRERIFTDSLLLTDGATQAHRQLAEARVDASRARRLNSGTRIANVLSMWKDKVAESSASLWQRPKHLFRRASLASGSREREHKPALPARIAKLMKRRRSSSSDARQKKPAKLPPGDLVEGARDLFEIGNVYVKEGRLTEALQQFQNVNDMLADPAAHPWNDRDLLSEYYELRVSALLQLSSCARQLSDLTRSRQAAEEAMQIVDREQLRSLRAPVRLEMARCLCAQNQLIDAVQYLLRFVHDALADGGGDNASGTAGGGSPYHLPRLMDATVMLGDVLVTLRFHDVALLYLEMALKVAVVLKAEDRLEQIQELITTATDHPQVSTTGESLLTADGSSSDIEDWDLELALGTANDDATVETSAGRARRELLNLQSTTNPWGTAESHSTLPQRYKVLDYNSASSVQIVKYPKPTRLYSLVPKDGHRMFNESTLETWLSDLVKKHEDEFQGREIMTPPELNARIHPKDGVRAPDWVSVYLDYCTTHRNRDPQFHLETGWLVCVSFFNECAQCLAHGIRLSSSEYKCAIEMLEIAAVLWDGRAHEKANFENMRRTLAKLDPSRAERAKLVETEALAHFTLSLPLKTARRVVARLCEVFDTAGQELWWDPNAPTSPRPDLTPGAEDPLALELQVSAVTDLQLFLQGISPLNVGPLAESGENDAEDGFISGNEEEGVVVHHLAAAAQSSNHLMTDPEERIESLKSLYPRMNGMTVTKAKAAFALAHSAMTSEGNSAVAEQMYLECLYILDQAQANTHTDAVIISDLGTNALIGYAECLMIDSKYRYAICSFEAAGLILSLRKEPGFQRLARRLAGLCADNKDWNRAVLYYTKILESEEVNVNEFVYVSEIISQICFRKGEFRKAEGYLLDAIEFLNKSGNVPRTSAGGRDSAPSTPRSAWASGGSIGMPSTFLIDLTLKLGELYLESYYPDLAISLLQTLLKRNDVPNIMRAKALTHLAKAFLRKKWTRDCTFALSALAKISGPKQSSFSASSDSSSQTGASSVRPLSLDASTAGTGIGIAPPGARDAGTSVSFKRLVARNYFNGKYYQPALAWIDSAVVDARCGRTSALGACYYYRGKIFQALAKSSHEVDFPTELFPEEWPAGDLRLSRNHSDPSGTGFVGEDRWCTSVGDLVCLGIRDFQRALDHAKLVGDNERIAKAASRLAQIRLDHFFPTVALLGRSMRHATSSLTSGSEVTKMDDPDWTMSLPAIEQSAVLSLEICADHGYVLLTLEAYLNMAEVRFLQGDTITARTFWTECVDRFQEFFVRDISVVLLDGAPMSFSDKLWALLKRMTRFLFALSKEEILQNLRLLDIFLCFESTRAAVERQPLHVPEASVADVASRGRTDTDTDSEMGRRSSSRSVDAPTAIGVRFPLESASLRQAGEASWNVLYSSKMSATATSTNTSHQGGGDVLPKTHALLARLASITKGSGRTQSGKKEQTSGGRKKTADGVSSSAATSKSETPAQEARPTTQHSRWRRLGKKAYSDKTPPPPADGPTETHFNSETYTASYNQAAEVLGSGKTIRHVGQVLYVLHIDDNLLYFVPATGKRRIHRLGGRLRRPKREKALISQRRRELLQIPEPVFGTGPKSSKSDDNGRDTPPVSGKSAQDSSGSRPRTHSSDKSPSMAMENIFSANDTHTSLTMSDDSESESDVKLVSLAIVLPIEGEDVTLIVHADIFSSLRKVLAHIARPFSASSSVHKTATASHVQLENTPSDSFGRTLARLLAEAENPASTITDQPDPVPVYKRGVSKSKQYPAPRAPRRAPPPDLVVGPIGSGSGSELGSTHASTPGSPSPSISTGPLARGAGDAHQRSSSNLSTGVVPATSPNLDLPLCAVFSSQQIEAASPGGYDDKRSMKNASTIQISLAEFFPQLGTSKASTTTTTTPMGVSGAGASGTTTVTAEMIRVLYNLIIDTRVHQDNDTELARSMKELSTDMADLVFHSPSSLLQETTVSLNPVSPAGSKRSGSKSGGLFSIFKRFQGNDIGPKITEFPVVLLCSRSLQIFPWETMLSEHTVVRAFNLKCLLFRAEPYVQQGYQAKTPPLPKYYVPFSTDEPKLLAHQQAQRTEWLAQQALFALNNVAMLPPALCVGRHFQVHPSPVISSPMLKYGKAVSSYRRKYKYVSFNDLTKHSGDDVLVRLVADQQSSGSNTSGAGGNSAGVKDLSYPVYFLALADLLEFGVPLSRVYTQRVDCTMIFVPGSHAKAAMTHLSKVQESIAKTNRKIGKSSGKESPAKGAPMETTSCYQLVMSAVRALQTKFSVPIVVVNPPLA